jgi:hypothetical protein
MLLKEIRNIIEGRKEGRKGGGRKERREEGRTIVSMIDWSNVIPS